MVSGEHGKNICYNLNLHISKAPLLSRDCWRRLVYFDETAGENFDNALSSSVR